MTQALQNAAADHRNGASVLETPGTPGTPRAQAIGWPDLQERLEDEAPARDGGASVLRDWSPLHQIKTTVQVCVGEATLSVGELISAKEHQVLRLDRSVDQPVDLMIEGKTVARGQLVAVDGFFAVRISELPVALGLPPGA